MGWKVTVSVLLLQCYSCDSMCLYGLHRSEKGRGLQLWNKYSYKRMVAMTWSREHKLSCIKSPSREPKQVKGTGQGLLWSREFMTNSQGASHSSRKLTAAGQQNSELQMILQWFPRALTPSDKSPLLEHGPDLVTYLQWKNNNNTVKASGWHFQD